MIEGFSITILLTVITNIKEEYTNAYKKKSCTVFRE